MSLEEKKWYDNSFLCFIVPISIVSMIGILISIFSWLQENNDKTNARIDKVYEKMIEIMQEKK